MTSPASQPALILASSSRYRADLLQRLGLRFAQRSPSVDESAQAGEAPDALARRLAEMKAAAVARLEPAACIIGSDQVASCEGRLLGKPGSRDPAIAQLRWMSGRQADFFTAVTVLHPAGDRYHHLDLTRVYFRTLTTTEIERYVDTEPAFDCAGSAKIEGLGITLTTQVVTTDPTALIGLPLIATATLLRQAGFPLP